MNNNNDDKILQEMDKDLEEFNENENKVNETLDKTNHNKEIFKKLEKHLSPDIPTIKFYDKIKYRGTSVIGVNFQSNKFQNRFYSRTKINELGNKISRFLQEEGVSGKLSNALLFPFGWKSGMFSEIGENVIVADVQRYLEFFEEPKHYDKFQFYVMLKPKAEGGNDRYNDCLYNCLHLHLYDRLPWKKPEELKKYLKLKRNDKVPIDLIKRVEEKLKTYAINIRGDYIYTSTIQSNKVINLLLSEEHYTLDRSIDNCKCKYISYSQKIPVFVDKKANVCYDGEAFIKKPLRNDLKYLLINRENYKITIEEEYKDYITTADILHKETKGVLDLRKGDIKTNALNLFDKFTKYILNPEKLQQDEAMWISEANMGAVIYAEKYEGPAHKYDVKSMYPSLLKSPLKFPIQRGEFKILSTEEFTNMQYFQVGIYRVIIEKSEDTNTNKLFRFHKHHYYTHTTLEHAKLLQLKMTIIQDDTANFLYYSRDKLIGCNEVFTTYIDYLFDLKERKIPKAKLILNVLWGKLCEVNKHRLVYKNQLINIDADDDVYSIKPDDKDENKLRIVTTKQSKYYTTGFARLSPFLISKGRHMIGSMCYPHREYIKQIHTDGIISDTKLDIKTGDNIGDLVEEGYCENVEIQHCNNVKGEFVKI